MSVFWGAASVSSGSLASFLNSPLVIYVDSEVYTASAKRTFEPFYFLRTRLFSAPAMMELGVLSVSGAIRFLSSWLARLLTS